MDSGFCHAAAALGKTGWLAYAQFRGHVLTADMAHSAFVNCQFETLAWLRLQQPPCPWAGLWEQPHPCLAIGLKPVPATAHTSNAQLQEVLRSLLKHAALPHTSEATQKFLNAFVMEVLDAMLSRHGLMKDAVRTVAAAGSVSAMRRLWHQYHYEMGEHRSACTEASRTGNVPIIESSAGTA